MNTFRDEIKQQFGVKLRKSNKNRDLLTSPSQSENKRPHYETTSYPTIQIHSEHERPHFEAPSYPTFELHSENERPHHKAPSHKTSQLYVDRCMYLPPEPPGAGNNRLSAQIDFNNRIIAGAGNWEFGNMKYQNFQTGTPGRQILYHGGDFTLQKQKKNNGGGIRRAQSFTSGPRPHSMYQTSSNNDIEMSSLLHQKDREMSASQTSLVSSGLSKIGGKINRVFSFKNISNKYIDNNKKRKLPEVTKEDKMRDLYRREQSFHGISNLRQNYSDLVSHNMFSSQSQHMNINLQNRQPPRDGQLPDVVNNERTNPSFPPVSANERLSWKDIIKKSNNLENNNDFIADDQWFSKEKLYKDHITEILEKWNHIEDEIWAKVIVLERNRRVAKAYARSPVLTINGSENGFDGFRIGVNGFDNPMRDHKVKEFKYQIGAGCKLKMDESGDILIKRIGSGNIYIKNTLEETAVSNDILKLPTGLLELDRVMKLFDMKKFKQNLNREIKRQYPDRNKIETQCIASIGFVKNEGEILDSPIWVMIINIVALDMLEDKIPIQKEFCTVNPPESLSSVNLLCLPNPSSLGTYSDLSSLSSSTSLYPHGLKNIKTTYDSDRFLLH